MALSDAAYSIAFYGACAWITFVSNAEGHGSTAC